MTILNRHYRSEDERKMHLAHGLLKNGWAFHLFSLKGSFRGREMAEWCYNTYGYQHGDMDPKTWNDQGRWIVFEMKFATPELRQYCIGFENEKMLLMWKMNFGDVLQAHDHN
jgi:hypothetical protein